MMDYEAGRCMNCDSRYCWDGCIADQPDTAYVVGAGWKTLDVAWDYLLSGYAVDWKASDVASKGRFFRHHRQALTATPVTPLRQLLA